MTLAAEQLDSLGMVVDFAEIKRLLTTWIDRHLDHRMLLHREDPLVPVLRGQGEPVQVLDVHPTAENLARLIYEQARSAGLPVVEVVFWETDDCRAVYRGDRDLPFLSKEKNFPVSA